MVWQIYRYLACETIGHLKSEKASANIKLKRVQQQIEEVQAAIT